MNKLVLFDIDRTMIRIMTETHRKAFSEGFKKVYGIDTNIDIIDHSGMTEQQIIFGVLIKSGLDMKIIKSKIKNCMKVIIEYFEENIKIEDIVVLAGVKELLDELKKHNVLVGLITGNLEQIAVCKLKKVGLNDYFKFGGFGSDDLDRAKLIKIAIKRAVDNFNFKFKNNVFVIGDNPTEIKAGKDAGVKTIGVATGKYSKEELEKSGADFVFENLEKTESILKVIIMN